MDLIKGIYEKLQSKLSKLVTITLKGKKLNTFPLRLVTRPACRLSPPLFNIVLEVLVGVTRKENIKRKK